MNHKLLAIVAATTVLGAAVRTEAATVTFDFNSLATGANSAAIQTYMQGLLSGGSTVSVTSGAVQTDNAYNGDGHVVGPCSPTCTSATLGPDTFLRNTAGIAGWSFVFGGGFVIDSVQFDYEIFPDGTCTRLSATYCGGAANANGIYPNQPDFTFSTNLGQVFHYYALTPGSGASGPAGNPSASTYTHSPISGAVATEKAPQLIGNTGLLVTGVAGATTLTFMDWPATIGIDNLVINYHRASGFTPVPEPGTIGLMAAGLAALVYQRRKRSVREQRSA
jgi:hypothetical protein